MAGTDVAHVVFEHMKTTIGVMTTMRTAIHNTKVRNTLIVLYILAVLGFSASARAEMEHFPIVHGTTGSASQTKTLVGEVALAVDGRVYLVVNDEVFYEMRNHEQELTALNGQRVQVTGYELMHRVGPVYQLSSFNPLLDDKSEQTPAPVLVVLRISGLTE